MFLGGWSLEFPSSSYRDMCPSVTPASAGRTAASQHREPLGRQVTPVPQWPCPLLMEHSGCPPASSQVCPFQSGSWSSPCSPHSVQGQALLTCLLPFPSFLPSPSCIPHSSSLPLPFPSPTHSLFLAFPAHPSSFFLLRSPSFPS